MQVEWTILKTFSTSKQISIQYLDLGDAYELRAYDGVFELSCNMPKDGGESVVDFETNFKPKGNYRLDQRDSDGAPLSRIKAAPTGWTYQLRGFEFTTADLSTIINKDATTFADLTDVTMKLYDVDGVQITDNVNKAGAVKTVIDYEPTFDHYIMGGSTRILSIPSSDVRLSVVAVPDVPAAYGGSKIMIQNINFKYVQEIRADGRAAKFLQYSATYHTNKLRFVVRHPAGENHGVTVYLEHFKL